MNIINRVALGDSYKYSHASQYPDMVSMYDYMEARGGEYPATVFVGLQGMLQEYFTDPIEMWEVQEAYTEARMHGVPFDVEGWTYIVKDLKGKIPVEIRAVKEGSLIPVKHPLMSPVSTDRKVPWVAGWMETFLMKVWYPTTVASKSYYVKQMLQKYGSPEWSVFAYHNFSDRGVTSVESAAICGMAHLTQFMGTDNFNSLRYIRNNYKIADNETAGYSVFATEHSTTTAHGRNGEKDFVIRMLKENPDKAIMSFVGDSYDIFEFTHFCTDEDSEIRQILEQRQNQKLVIRPDSGDPIKVISNMLAIMENNNVFDIEINGRKASTKFGILWGDGITQATIELILKTFTEMGYAAENFVFGSGGDLGQNITRDTCKFVIKCSSITDINGNEIEVFKDPITDPGKTSKKGKVTTYFNKNTKEFFVDRVNKEFDGAIDILETVYKNGEMIKTYSFAEVRENINAYK